jgi:hypothetical protein
MLLHYPAHAIDVRNDPRKVQSAGTGVVTRVKKSLTVCAGEVFQLQACCAKSVACSCVICRMDYFDLR